MSYILDALKKSDRERQRRTAPGIHTVQTAAEEHSRSRILWPYILVLALLLNAGLLVWWLEPWKSGGVPTAAEDPGKQELAAAAAVPVKGTRHDGSPGATQEAPSPRPKEASLKKPETKPLSHGAPAPVRPSAERAAPATQASSRLSKAEENKAIQEKHASKAEVPGSPDSRLIRPRQQPSAGLASIEPSKKHATTLGRDDTGDVVAARRTSASTRTADHPVDRTPGSPAATPTPAATKAEGEIEPAKPKTLHEEEDTVPPISKLNAPRPDSAGAEPKPHPDKASETEKSAPQLRELPLDIQKDVPDLSFSMLVFSHNPPDRMVGINGKVMREGEEVAAGLKVERITPDGAILNFRGHRFHKGVH